MRQLCFNGKFYAAGLNGVHRVADRLIREIDRLLDDPPAGLGFTKATLYLPERRRWEPQLSNIELVYERAGHTLYWEQFILPLRARDGLLVNLCNLSPVLHKPKITMIHDAQFLFPDSSYPARLKWGYRLLTPWMARSSERVLTVSEYSRQMLDLCGVSCRDRTDLVHNGADHIEEVAADASIIQRLGLSRRAYVVHLASTKAYKNSSVIFDAFRRPELDGLALLIVGPDRAELELKGLAPPPGAIFAGRVNDAELRALYEDALCLVFPSRTEGFGLPPVEAMSCGCPSVAAPGGAIPEICRDAVAYADVGDDAHWAAAVARYRDDGAYRDQKIVLGRARASDFTWRAAGQHLLATIAATAQ